jgi:hypothetical protein
MCNRGKIYPYMNRISVLVRIVHKSKLCPKYLNNGTGF